MGIYYTHAWNTNNYNLFVSDNLSPGIPHGFHASGGRFLHVNIMYIKQMTIAEQAFAYHANGYQIMPCKMDKRPALKTWAEWQTQDQEPDLILNWWNKTPNAPIGIITGKKSGIIVIDVDTYAGATDIFPETFTVRTGNGGLQKYYQYTEGFTISANGYPNMPHVDIRSDGGYVIGAGSVTDYLKDGKKAGGEYTVVNNRELAPFPSHLFPTAKKRKTLTEKTTAKNGSRNDNITSFIGTLLQSHKEEDWYSECLPAAERISKTYIPPTPLDEVRRTFESIVKKERQRREGLIISPIQMDDGETIPETTVKLRKNGSGIPYKDMANVMIVLENHPFYQKTIRYNEFKQEIEYNGAPIEDSDIIKIQHFMQLQAGLPNIGKEAVFSAILHYAYKNKYDEAQDWLTSLDWDQTPRLADWLHIATGVENDAYHQGIGSRWFMGIINRIMRPGCIWDYMLVLCGAQGVGKSSLFRIIGGDWCKSFTGSVENKDFYLTLKGAIIIDLDEGATLYKAEAIKIKSIITQTHDEFRAPYDRVMKKYPRRFVFSMSTNDSEPFRDVTGNRRYWVLDLPDQMVNFKWLEENREQLFAEAYHYFKNKIEVAEVPMDEAREKQEAHLPDDSWTDLVADEVRKSAEYCDGSEEYSTTIMEVYVKVFPQESIARLDKRHEMRIGNIFRKQLGLEKMQKMIDGERKNRYYISEKKIKELKAKNVKKTADPLNDFVAELKSNEF